MTQLTKARKIFTFCFSWSKFTRMETFRNDFKSFPFKLLLWSSPWIVSCHLFQSHSLWCLRSDDDECGAAVLKFAQSAGNLFEESDRGSNDFSIWWGQNDFFLAGKFDRINSASSVWVRVIASVLNEGIEVNKVHHHTTYKLIMILMTFSFHFDFAFAVVLKENKTCSKFSHFAVIKEMREP